MSYCYTLEQIFELNQTNLDNAIKDKYNDNIKYRTLREKRNALIILAYNVHDIDKNDVKYVACDEYDRLIWEVSSAKELKFKIDFKLPKVSPRKRKFSLLNENKNKEDKDKNKNKEEENKNNEDKTKEEEDKIILNFLN